MFMTELRVFSDREETLLNKYINSIIAGDIKSLTIKEEWIMLEELKKQREELALEVEKIKQTNLEAVINERVEAAKQTIAEEVVKEFDEKITEAELKVQHYDFVIQTLEEKEKANLEAELAEQNQEISDYNEVQ